MDTRERLNAATFDSLQAMMTAYAEQAVATAWTERRQRLDFSDASVTILEGILARIDPPAAEDQDFLTRLWGSYFGEVLRRRFGGEWIMSVYPGGDLSLPTLDVQGSRLYPLLKVYRRLTMGESENLSNFYHLVRQRLGEGPSKLGQSS